MIDVKRRGKESRSHLNKGCRTQSKVAVEGRSRRSQVEGRSRSVSI